MYTVENKEIAFGLDDIPQRKTLAWKKEKDCVIILSTEGKRVILNPRSTLVWENIDEVNSVGDIIQVVSSRLDEPPETAANFVRDVTGKLLDLDFISFDDFLWIGDDDEESG